MLNQNEKLKIICLQENLKNGLIIAERALGNNLTLPILNNALMKSEKGFLKISSTNLEMGIEILIPCKIEHEGEVVVPIKHLLNFINNLPNIKLSLIEDDGKIIIESDNLKTKIPIINKDDFPIIPKIENGNIINIKSQIFKKSLNQVLNSTSLTSQKQETLGVFFNFKKDYIKLASTDSFRLSEKTIIKKDDNFSIEKPLSFILPLKTCYELVKIIDFDDFLKIKVNNNQVGFSFDKINLISKIIDGEYPNYEQIIPKTNKTSIYLSKNELMSKIKLASLFSSNINDIKLLIDVKNKIFSIKSLDVIKGEFSSNIEFNDIQGENLEVLFNYKYILDGLSNIQDDNIIFELNGYSAPVVLKSKELKDYIYIIMPLRS